MAKDNFRPNYTGLRHEIQKTILRNTFSELPVSHCKNDGAGKGSGTERNRGDAENGSNNNSETQSRSVSKLNFDSSKESDGFRPIKNLKKLNSYVEYKHFKMKGLFLLNKLLEKGDFLCKLDLMDA